MGLREDAIRQFEDQRDRRAAKEKKEREDSIARDVENAKKHICRAFGISECPELILAENPSRYSPDCSFELDGVKFQYILGNSNICVKITCPKCRESWIKSVSISTTNGKTDLSDLGHELSKEHDNCPADWPERPQPPPRPPVKMVEYAIGSAEQRFLEALDELVGDIMANRE